MVKVEPTDNGFVFRLSDDIARLSADLELRLDPETGVLAQRITVRNDGDKPFDIGWCAAASWAMPWRTREALSFEGRWSREFQERRVALTLGRYVRENRKGRTSHDTFPGMIVGTQGFGETTGEVWGCHLGWSGNHRMLAETLSDGGRQVQLGELLSPGEVKLAKGATYTSPWAYGAYSAEGLNGLTDRFHRFVRDTLITWPGGSMKPRPVIANTWEAVYFSHDLDRLAALADRAASVGAERFVLDDGWFGGDLSGRDDDTTSLGDWQIDHRKWPAGLHPLIDHVRGLGMEFGLWVEPEMVSPQSDLYQAHPDWALHVPGRRRPTARHQLVLDLTLPEAFDHVWQALDTLLKTHEISYLKWDMNRDLAPSASAGVPVQSAQTKAVYALIERLRAAHPSVEIESCASGGSRADYGALARTHRVWTSDCNDAHERQRIQRGAARFLPLCVLGCHIGPNPAHTTGGHDRLEFRAITALFGHMGLELNLLDLTQPELDEIAQVISVHKHHRALLHAGRYVRLDDDLEPGCMGHGVVAPDGAEAMYAVVQLDSPETTTSPPRAPARPVVRPVLPRSLCLAGPGRGAGRYTLNRRHVRTQRYHSGRIGFVLDWFATANPMAAQCPFAACAGNGLSRADRRHQPRVGLRLQQLVEPRVKAAALDERDDRAAEPAAGEARTDGPQRERCLDQGIHGGNGNGVIVALRGMACGHELAECLKIAVVQGGDTVQHPLVFGHHMPCALVQRGRQSLDPRQVGHRQFAQAGDAERATRRLTLGNPLAVAAVRQLMLDPGIDHRDVVVVGQGRRLRCQVARVQEQRLAGPGDARRLLIHDAAGHADELALGRLRELGDLNVVDRQVQCRAHGLEDRDLERGGTGDAGANRNVGNGCQAQRRRRHSRVAQRVETAKHIVQPVLALAVDQVRAKRSAEAFADPFDLAEPTLGRRQRDPRATTERGRQDEAVIVVGMLAQQVGACRRAGDRGRFAAEGLGEQRVGAGLDRHQRLGRASRSRSTISSGATSARNTPVPCSMAARYFSLSALRCRGRN